MGCINHAVSMAAEDGSSSSDLQTPCHQYEHLRHIIKQISHVSASTTAHSHDGQVDIVDYNSELSGCSGSDLYHLESV